MCLVVCGKGMCAADLQGGTVGDAQCAAESGASTRGSVGAEGREVKRASHDDDISRTGGCGIKRRKMATQGFCQAATDAQGSISQVVCDGLNGRRGRIVHCAGGGQRFGATKAVVAGESRGFDQQSSSSPQD